MQGDLPYVYIAHVMKDKDGIWFKFRLIGADIIQTIDRSGTDRMLLDLQIGGWEEEWRKNLIMTTKLCMAVVDETKIVT